MKKIVIVLALLVAVVQGRNGMVDLTPEADTDVATARILGDGEQCDVYISSDDSVSTTCRTMVNSRGVRIFCTRRKSVCKTLDEVRAFLLPQDGEYTQTTASYQDCLDGATSTLAMRKCNAKELAYQDDRLNANYQAAMRHISAREKTILRKAQRAWIRYRDSKCQSEGLEMRGGSGEYLLIGGCLVDETRKRADELRRMF